MKITDFQNNLGDPADAMQDMARHYMRLAEFRNDSNEMFLPEYSKNDFGFAPKQSTKFSQ